MKHLWDILGLGVVLRCADTRRVSTLCGAPLLAWDAGAERLAMALLDHRRLAPQGAIAEAFGVTRVTVWRASRAWENEGPAGVLMALGLARWALAWPASRLQGTGDVVYHPGPAPDRRATPRSHREVQRPGRST